MRMPARSSCTNEDISPNWSCTARERRCTLPPITMVAIGRPRVGRSAQNVSDGEIVAIIGMIMRVRTVVSTMYMIARIHDHAGTSRISLLVAFTIRSPTGNCWKNPAERDIRCVKRSSRKSVSTRRDALLRNCRIPKRSTPPTSASPTTTSAATRTARRISGDQGIDAVLDVAEAWRDEEIRSRARGKPIAFCGGRTAEIDFAGSAGIASRESSGSGPRSPGGGLCHASSW